MHIAAGPALTRWPIVSTSSSELLHSVNLRSLTSAAVVCDPSGRILLANSNAEDMLASLIDEEQRIRVEEQTDSAAFVTFLGEALKLRCARSIPSMVYERAFPETTLIFRAIRLGVELCTTAPSAILLIIEEFRSDLHEVLRGQFDLTTSEARIAADLADGVTIGKICVRRNVKRGTVRSHLKAIFAKTNTRSQVQLVLLLSKLRWQPIRPRYLLDRAH